MRKFHWKPLLGLIERKLDHTFSDFGAACTACGGACGTANLTYGSAPGSYDGHPRADNGECMDHRRILVESHCPRGTAPGGL